MARNDAKVRLPHGRCPAVDVQLSRPFRHIRPAQQDPRTQFYVAYAFYREGWGRVYYDDALFKQGLEAVNRAINLAPNGILTIDDPNLQMHSAAELKTELEQGIERSWKDLNPLKLFRERK